MTKMFCDSTQTFLLFFASGPQASLSLLAGQQNRDSAESKQDKSDSKSWRRNKSSQFLAGTDNFVFCLLTSRPALRYNLDFIMPPTFSYSVVVPVYYGEHTIRELFTRLSAVFFTLDRSFEIIFVDDCGPDGSWDVIQDLVRENASRVKGIKLSRNFGQHRAITAGLDHCLGERVVVMDCDLQDVPEELLKLCRCAEEGVNVVLARRVTRQDNWLKCIYSAVFYRLLSYLTNTYQDKSIANFGVYHRKVIDAVIRMREDIRYFPVMVRWVGFSTQAVDVAHARRVSGESGYNFRKGIRLAVDVVIAFSDKPLRAVVTGGVVLSVFSLLTATILTIGAIAGSFHVSGWASLMVSIWFLTGITTFSMGIVGLYMGKTFEQAKQRPLYVVDSLAHSDPPFNSNVDKRREPLDGNLIQRGKK